KPIPQKVSLRAVQNGHITMKDVVVPEADRLQNINGFSDVAKILVNTRADVAHIAAGVTGGAFVAALDYVKERDQFGKKLGQFQIIQEKLACMQANTVAAIGYSVRLAEMLEEDDFGMRSEERRVGKECEG